MGALVVSDFGEEKLLTAIGPGKFFKLGAAVLPCRSDFLLAWIDTLREREICEYADVIERIPEFYIGIFIPVCAVSQLTVINLAHGFDDFSPAIFKFLGVGKFQPDAQNRCAV